MDNTTTAASSPAIFKQAQAFLDAIPPRRVALERARGAAKLAHDELFQARTFLLQASSAARTAGPDDPQYEEHKRFETQCSEKVAAAHLALQKARLAVVQAEAAVFADDGRTLIAPLRQAVETYQRAEIERYLKDEFEPASDAYLKVLQRGHALASALLAHGQTLSLDVTDAPASVKALSEALLHLPEAVGAWQTSDAAAKPLLDLLKAPRLLLESLQRHNSECKAFIDNRNARRLTAAQSGRVVTDSAGVFLSHQAIRFNGQDFPRGTYFTLADLEPAGGLDKLRQLVQVGHLQLISDEAQRATGE